ncbi:MAG: hypothetical protein ACKVQK_29715 [Burkholderiales bacterium]
MTPEDNYATVALETLREAIAKALDRKHRLGQYAVIWRDGQVVRIGPSAPEMRYPRLDQTATAPGVAEPGKE